MIDDRTLELTRRGFFGAAAATLVASVAPRRAYSFLEANPLASGWSVVTLPGRLHDGDVLVVSSAERARELWGGDWRSMFGAMRAAVLIVRAPGRVDLLASVAKGELHPKQ